MSNLNGITVNGIPIKKWLSREDQIKSEPVTKIDENIVYCYRKPKKTYTVKHNIKPGKVRHLTKDEIREEYGIMSLNDMGHVERLLYSMVSASKQGQWYLPLSLNDFIQRANMNKESRSPSAALSMIWKRLGSHKNGLGYINRGKSRPYKYYPTEKFTTDLDTETLYKIYLKAGKKTELVKSMDSPDDGIKVDVNVKENIEIGKERSVGEITVKDWINIPSELNININIRLGFLK